MSATRLVVACRLPGALRYSDAPTEALARLEALVERAVVLGGVVISSSYDGVAFAWDEAATKAAVSLATSATYGALEGEPVWACGMACGDIEVGKAVSPGGPPFSGASPSRSPGGSRASRSLARSSSTSRSRRSCPTSS